MLWWMLFLHGCLVKSRGHADPAVSLKRRFDLGKPKERKPRANVNWGAREDRRNQGGDTSGEIRGEYGIRHTMMQPTGSTETRQNIATQMIRPGNASCVYG